MSIMKPSGQSITRLSATSLRNKTTFIEIDNLKGSITHLSKKNLRNSQSIWSSWKYIFSTHAQEFLHTLR